MATIRALRARAGAPSAVSAEYVRAYYDANRSRYHAEERIAVWRILCPTRDEAQIVLDSWRQDGATPAAFADLAREHSRDKSTYMRSGDLGFLAPDGSSSFSELRVDPALFRAAAGVRDGEIVSAPVVESDGFGVVWRRGTIPAVDRKLEEVADSIRDQLSKDRVKEETDRLVAALRSSHLRNLDTSPLETLEIDLDAGRP
jgi:peptidyl-prolyl cis-trans isomerase C